MAKGLSFSQVRAAYVESMEVNTFEIVSTEPASGTRYMQERCCYRDGGEVFCLELHAVCSMRSLPVECDGEVDLGVYGA